MREVGCYAACMGTCKGPLTREHYVSKSVLELFPRGFLVEGPAWARQPRAIGVDSLTSKILCARHNSDLSPLDAQASRLFDLVRRAVAGEQGGGHEFDGEAIERWALKVLVGTLRSGTLFGAAGRAASIPDAWIRMLFAREPFASECGFYYCATSVAGWDADLITIAPLIVPANEAEAGTIFGIGIRVPGFQFVTSVTRPLGGEDFRYRPGGFELGSPDRGRLRFHWPLPSQVGLVLKL
jgi:hypothetical protein